MKQQVKLDRRFWEELLAEEVENLKYFDEIDGVEDFGPLAIGVEELLNIERDELRSLLKLFITLDEEVHAYAEPELRTYTRWLYDLYKPSQEPVDKTEITLIICDKINLIKDWLDRDTRMGIMGR